MEKRTHKKPLPKKLNSKMTWGEYLQTPEGQQCAKRIADRINQFGEKIDAAKAEFVGDSIQQHTDPDEREWRVRHELRNATGMTAKEFDDVDVAEVLPLLRAAGAMKHASCERDAGTTPNVPLDAEGQKIITYLRDQAPRLRTQTDIETDTYVSRKTVSKRLAELSKLALIAYPCGRNKGVTITKLGRKVADAISPKLPQ